MTVDVDSARAHASAHGYETVVAALVAASSGNTAVNETGNGDVDSALLEHAKKGDLQAVADALVDGAHVDTRDDFDRTPLLWAVTNDHVEVAQLLLSFGADVNAVDGQQDTPWLVTGVTGSAEIGSLLLDYDIDFSLVNRYGGNPIIPASERGHVDYVKTMVKEPKITVDYLNHVNNLGWTAMLEAVILGDGGKAHQEIVRTLLEAGADPNIADFDGKTPLDHARARGYSELVEILEDSQR